MLCEIRERMVLIVDDLGLREPRILTQRELIDIWKLATARGLTAGATRENRRDFMRADSIVEAETGGGESRYIAAAISYTAGQRDICRAIRNARFLTNFLGTLTYAVVAVVHRDEKIDSAVTTDIPEPYSDEREALVFWSQHDDIKWLS